MTMTKLKLINADQLATHLSVGRNYIYRLVKQGMPCIRIGARRYLRFELSEVMDWIEKQDQTA